jgi:glucosamine--fructose-6-phosphate aminotransferase (isomerizing)
MEQEIIERSPAPYEHWTLKEIMEQPEALSRTLSYGARFSSDGSMVKLGGLEGNLDKLLTIQNLLIGACGTSYFAGLYGMKIMQNLQCFDNVQCVDASEITKDVFPQKNNGLLVISQSGETKDTHRSVQLAQHNGIPVFSIINQVGSLIARATNCGVYLRAGREHGVASTKAFTTQVTALALVAGWFSQQRTADDAAYAQAFLSDGTEDSILKLQGQHHLQLRNSRLNSLLQSVHALPVYAGMALRTHDQCKHIAEKLKDKPSLFILGKGFAEPIAYEGALKIKEITYIHAEGYSGGALKHGPFALLEKGTPVILMILDDSHAELMRIAAQEVRARHAYTIVITDKPSLAEGLGDEIITIPHNGPMTALLATIPLQLLAYEISIKKGYNPDKPRNLAKAVTVD